MNNSVIIIILAFVYVVYSSEFNQPLFLTPYIEKKKFSDALIDSKVTPLKKDIESYAGFFTVNKAYNSSMFMWFFPAEQSPEKAPLVLWLQGGPGKSALYGIFEENGPFYIKIKRGMGFRKDYWSRTMNMLYLDSPIGTGFSFTSNSNGYPQDQAGIAKDIYEVLSQFFQIFSDYKKNDFYIIGEGYGAKFATSAAALIDTKNPGSRNKINLKGIGLGNPFDLSSMMKNYADLFFNVGLIGSDSISKFKNKQDETIKFIQQKQHTKAADSYLELMIGNENDKSLFKKVTEFENVYNIKFSTDKTPYGNLEKALEEKSVIRRNIHVGTLPFQKSELLFDKLKADIPLSMKPMLDKLINKNYRIFIYSGQFSVVQPYRSTVDFSNSLSLDKGISFDSAARFPWKFKGELIGYCRNVGTLTEMMIRDAGGRIAMDQPEWSYEVINSFTYNNFTCPNQNIQPREEKEWR